MFSPHKTDGFDQKASGDYLAKNGTVSAVWEKNDGKRLSTGARFDGDLVGQLDETPQRVLARAASRAGFPAPLRLTVLPRTGGAVAPGKTPFRRSRRASCISGDGDTGRIQRICGKIRCPLPDCFRPRQDDVPDIRPQTDGTVGISCTGSRFKGGFGHGPGSSHGVAPRRCPPAAGRICHQCRRKNRFQPLRRRPCGPPVGGGYPRGGESDRIRSPDHQSNTIPNRGVF